MLSFLRQAPRRFNLSVAPPWLPRSSPTSNWSSPSPLRRPHGEPAVPPPALAAKPPRPPSAPTNNSMPPHFSLPGSGRRT